MDMRNISAAHARILEQFDGIRLILYPDARREPGRDDYYREVTAKAERTLREGRKGKA